LTAWQQRRPWHVVRLAHGRQHLCSPVALISLERVRQIRSRIWETNSLRVQYVGACSYPKTAYTFREHALISAFSFLRHGMSAFQRKCFWIDSTIIIAARHFIHQAFSWPTFTWPKIHEASVAAHSKDQDANYSKEQGSTLQRELICRDLERSNGLGFPYCLPAIVCNHQRQKRRSYRRSRHPIAMVACAPDY